MSALDNRNVLFTDTGTDGLPDPLPIPLSIERVSETDGDHIHVIVGDARVVFDSDHFLEILSKVRWATVVDRGVVRSRT